MINKNDVDRNHIIDITKGVCILFVIFTHYGWSECQRQQMLFPFWIDMAVPMFMIISGYLSAFSFEKKQIYSLKSAFSFNLIFQKCVRFVIPFFIAFCIDVFVQVVFLENTSAKRLMHLFFIGGNGPGSYYFPIMLQFVFIFPFIYIFIKKYDFIGLFILFFVNAMYEFLQRMYGLNEECYRLLLFRYIFVISFGCYLYLFKNQKIKKPWYLVSLILGGGYIVLVKYTSYSPSIIIYWTGTCFISCLYILPIASFILKKDSFISLSFLELLGKASFNIFLTQMLYYSYAKSIVYSLVSNVIIRLCINFFICCVVGILFYYIESIITKRIINKNNVSDINYSKIIYKLFLEEKNDN